jgi:hypothetical protein
VSKSDQQRKGKALGCLCVSLTEEELEPAATCLLFADHVRRVARPSFPPLAFARSIVYMTDVPSDLAKQSIKQNLSSMDEFAWLTRARTAHEKSSRWGGGPPPPSPSAAFFVACRAVAFSSCSKS